MTDPIGTAQELIDSLRARSKDNWRDELGGSTCELIEEAADALQSRIAEVGRLEDALRFVRAKLTETANYYPASIIPTIDVALSLHRRPT